MIDAKLQKVANKTAKVISEFLKLPEPEKYEVRLVEEYENDGELKISEDKDHPLIICPISDEPLEMFTAIAHLLRQLYQKLYHYEEYFTDYSPELMHDMNAFNDQPSQIDAVAFYSFLCEAVFNVGCPPLENCSESVYEKIVKRAKELFFEYYTNTEFNYLKGKFQNNPIFEIYRESAKNISKTANDI